jgi:hypothetical protein
MPYPDDAAAVMGVAVVTLAAFLILVGLAGLVGLAVYAMR